MAALLTDTCARGSSTASVTGDSFTATLPAADYSAIAVNDVFAFQYNTSTYMMGNWGGYVVSKNGSNKITMSQRSITTNPVTFWYGKPVGLGGVRSFKVNRKSNVDMMELPLSTYPLVYDINGVSTKIDIIGKMTDSNSSTLDINIRKIRGIIDGNQSESGPCMFIGDRPYGYGAYGMETFFLMLDSFDYEYAHDSNNVINYHITAWQVSPP